MNVKRYGALTVRVLAFVLVSLIAISCGGRGNSSRRGAGDSVTSLYIGDERIFFQDYWGMEATYWMFEPLVRRAGDESGKVRPALAEKWEHSDDYRTWKFYLRKDVRWHDGQPVTANDIKFTLDLRINPEVNPGAEKDKYKVDVIDDHTFTITYKIPTDGLDTWAVYYPKHLLENLDPKDFFKWEFWKAPVGNGPYKLVRSIPKTAVEVEANPDYYGKVPAIKHVTLKFSDTPSLTELYSGNVESLSFVSGDMAKKLEGDDRYRSYHWWGSWIDVIYWDHSGTFFSSPEVRRALTMAINRRELAEVLDDPEDVPILDTVTTQRQFKRHEFPEPLKYDPAGAKKLLAAEGWNDSDGDGVLDKDGKAFEFPLTVNAEMQKSAIYVQNELRKVGVKADIQTVDMSILRKKHRSGEYDALLFRFQNPDWIYRFFDSDSPFGYKNDEMIALVKKARVTIDPDKQDEVMKDIMKVMERDIPVTFLVPQVQFFIATKRIKGLSSPDRADPVWFMPTLTLEDGG